jgi:hypothetical protein
MATQEFYIREASETEARGPFNMEQLVSLAETGQVTVDTFWYDPTLEDWVQIGANDELKASLFPEKRKLRMKVRENIPQEDVGLPGAHHDRGHAGRRRGPDRRDEGQGRPGDHAGASRADRDVVGRRLPRSGGGRRDSPGRGRDRRGGHQQDPCAAPRVSRRARPLHRP